MWGSVDTPTGNGTGARSCLSCPNIQPCRAATMARQPVKCEDYARHLTGRYAVLNPGTTFTVPELAKLVDISPSNAAKWASNHMHAGHLAVIGTAYTTDRYGNKHPTKIYKLSEATL